MFFYQQLCRPVSESLIVSHGVPVVSKIVKASPQTLYIALILRLNLNIIRGLYEEFGESALSMINSKPFHLLPAVIIVADCSFQ